VLHPTPHAANNPFGAARPRAELHDRRRFFMGRQSVVTVHQIVGTLVVLAYLVLTVVNIMRATGRQITWARPLSFGAAGLLVLQYLLGFSLLGSDHKITAWHYLFALCAILTVGVEHGMANANPPSGNARLAAAATAGTTILTLIAYAIGSSN
jgi:heme A synthase